MKKIFTFAVIAFASVALVSCGGETEKKSAEELSFEEAYKEALNEATEAVESLSSEAIEDAKAALNTDDVKDAIELAKTGAKAIEAIADEIDEDDIKTATKAAKALVDIAEDIDDDDIKAATKAAKASAKALEALADESDDEDLKAASKAAKAGLDLVNSLF